MSDLPFAFLMLAVLGCSVATTSTSECTMAGGKCLGAGSNCPKRGAEECNPDQDPPGAFCCLPCSAGSTNDAGMTCR
ncbi:MAG TPA: hypothetical protein VHO67_03720 [Polyangia bacterium]|nr:hypothetical protein [Polyangia bacterium]